MIALSFRFKLLLAMMLVVVGVSGATLYITDKKVQAAYEKLFLEKLEAQIMYLPKEQEARLSNVKEVCQNLSRLVRFQAAMTDVDTDVLYQLALDELSRFIGQTQAANEAAPAGPEGPQKGIARKNTKAGMVDLAKTKRMLLRSPAYSQPRQATFVVFFDKEGKMLQSSNTLGRALALKSESRQRFQQQIGKFGSVIRNLDSQHVGYMEIDPGQRPGQLVEVVVTPIIDGADQKTLGAMALAFPFNDQGEQVISDVSEIDNGLWVSGHLHTRTIPEAVREPLAKKLGEELQKQDAAKEDFLIEVADQPYRVFYTPLNPGSPLPAAYKVGVYSAAAERKERQDLRMQILGFTGLALAAALGASLLLAHGMTVSLRELARGTTEIKEGNLAITLPVRSRDEFGQLAGSFNEMVKGLALKEQYHDVLNKVTDKDVAEQLMAGKLTLGGEMREANVMFCDIRGFTALTQNMNPAEVIHMLNEHMTALTKVVNEHNGVVDKFIGDSIMAVFGAPKSYGNDAHNAASCAVCMIQERERLNQTSKYKIKMGIGIATGPVLAGNMGSEGRFNYTVIGDRVNLAARLCSVAAPMEVVISDVTRAQLGTLVEAQQMEDLKLKGFSDNVRAFKLTEVHSLPAST